MSVRLREFLASSLKFQTFCCELQKSETDGYIKISAKFEDISSRTTEGSLKNERFYSVLMRGGIAKTASSGLLYFKDVSEVH